MKKSSISIYIIFFLCLSLNPFADEYLWQYSAGGDLRSFMKEGADGSLYLLAEDKALHSLDPETGMENWLYRPDKEIQPQLFNSPDGSLFLLSGDEIHCLSSSAHLRWAKQVSGKTLRLLASGSDSSCYLSVNGQLVKYDRRGRFVWSFVPGRRIEEILIHPGGLVLLRYSNEIICLNAYSGERRWQRDISSDYCLLYTDFFRILDNNSICEYDYNGSLIRQDSLSGFDGDYLTSRDDDLQCAVYSRNQGVMIYPEKRIVYTRSSDELAGFFNDNSLILRKNNSLIHVRGERENTIFKGDILQRPLISRDNHRIYIFSSLWLLKCIDSSWLPSPSSKALKFGELQSDRWFARYYPDYPDYRVIAGEADTAAKKRLLGKMSSLLEEDHLKSEMPYYPLLLSAMSSTESPTGNQFDYVLNSSVELRSAVYRFMAEIDDFNLREIIISRLKTERDTAVLSSAVEALGLLGVDFDGRGTEAVYRMLNRVEDPGNQLAIESIRCLVNIGKHEGRLPAMSSTIVKKVLNLSLNSDARNKIRNILSAELK